jgi:hypothetical protein
MRRVDSPSQQTVSTLLTVLQDDMRHVHFRITAALGIAAAVRIRRSRYGS